MQNKPLPNDSKPLCFVSGCCIDLIHLNDQSILHYLLHIACETSACRQFHLFIIFGISVFSLQILNVCLIHISTLQISKLHIFLCQCSEHLVPFDGPYLGKLLKSPCSLSVTKCSTLKSIHPIPEVKLHKCAQKGLGELYISNVYFDDYFNIYFDVHLR